LKEAEVQVYWLILVSFLAPGYGSHPGIQ
jgi:hypothetical protein